MTQSVDWRNVRDAAHREAFGQVFTPIEMAALLVDTVDVVCTEGWPDRTVLDPACGAGSLLLAVARARRAAGWPVVEILSAMEGWDRDPLAVEACRRSVVDWAVSEANGVLPSLPRVFVVDALGSDGRAGALLRREPPFERGVGAVIANPPYLEAKRMGRAEPGLRERLRRDFPDLSGAFDLYLAFCRRALDQVGEGGRIGLIVPNKLLEGRYAALFRRRVLEQLSIAHLADLSRMTPRPFPGTGVYPVIMHLRNDRTRGPVRVMRATRAGDLTAPRWTTVDPEDLRRVGGEQPLFVPFEETWTELAPLFALPRLGSIARMVSTCSFHRKGLRERFVTPHRPDADAYPYLGGPSRTRRSEVETFRTRWAGWYIRYDAEVLRSELDNPLPDLARTFLRPKVIVCQHATRVRVVADFDAEWVTKDVYPVGWPTDERWTVGMLAAVLSSTVFTALYNTVYQGILIGGETYHYLPAFLHSIPVPENLRPLVGIEGAIAALQAEPGEVDRHRWDEVDRAVAQAYGLDESARQRMIEVHLERVGAERPGR